MTFGAYRACPQCQTRNKPYMLVCRSCNRTLEGVPLEAASEAAAAPGDGLGRSVPLALVLGLAAALGLAVLLVRLLRAPSLEGEAVASGPAALAPPPPRAAAAPTPHPEAAWETIEERWAQVAARTSAPAAPPIAAPPSAPTPSVGTVSPAWPPPAPPATATAGGDPQPSAGPRLPPAVSPSASAPRPPALARAARVEGREDDVRDAVEEDERWRDESRPDADDPSRLRAERQRALRRAEERLRALDRRAAALRARMSGEVITDPDEHQELQSELRDVLRQVERAEREVIRAEWALSDSER